MFLARIAETILRNYTVLARLIAECLEIKLVTAVNQICRFASTMKTKFDRKLTVACHRHPTEKLLSSSERKWNLLVLVDPSLLHQTFLLGLPRITALSSRGRGYSLIRA